MIQNYEQNFRPAVNIPLVSFGGGVVVVLLLVVTGVKQSQLLDLSLGLEFDKITQNCTLFHILCEISHMLSY